MSRMDRFDDQDHLYHGGHPGHDSHYAIVNEGGPVATQYFPPQYKYDEVVIAQESQLLPLALVFFKI